MSLEEAMSVFKIVNESEITEENIKKVYRSLCFQYHPDAHQNEDEEYYNNMMKQINEAYEILRKYTPKTNYQNNYEEKKRNEKQQQIVKEQILMDIIVRAYYAAKAEIDKINEDFMDYFLSIPQQVGHIPSGSYGKPETAYRHIRKAFEEKAIAESEIMNEYIKKFAIEFADKYGIEIDFLEIVTGEYINFLNNNRTWYDKYCSYKGQEEPKKLK